MTVKESLHASEEKLKKSIEALMREFSEVRTGRASPHLVEGLHIDYYGTPTLLKQLASFSVAPRMIFLTRGMARGFILSSSSSSPSRTIV